MHETNRYNPRIKKQPNTDCKQNTDFTFQCGSAYKNKKKLLINVLLCLNFYVIDLLTFRESLYAQLPHHAVQQIMS